MKNKRRRMRKFLVISLVVTILALVTVFIATSFAPSLAQEESDYEQEPFDCVRCWEIVSECYQNASETFQQCLNTAERNHYDCVSACESACLICDIFTNPIASKICYAICATPCALACAELYTQEGQDCIDNNNTRMDACDQAKQNCIDHGCEE